MTCWRMSRSLEATRTVSPWMLAFALSFESLMAATIFLAFSLAMPLLELDLLADALTGGLLDLLVLEVLERDAALDELLREDLDDSGEGVLVGAGELDGLFLFELDLRLGVLEVEAGVDLFGGLVDGVFDFLDLYFAYYVEAVVGCHGFFPDSEVGMNTADRGWRG